MPTTRPCGHCGTTTSSPKFCSNICHLRATNGTRAAKRRKPRPICTQCGVGTVMRDAKHCSRECSTAARRASRPPLPPCRRCGRTDPTERRRDGPYCTWECWNEDRYENGPVSRWRSSWLAGEISGTNDKGKPDWRVREALVAIRGQCCEECGWAKVNPISGRVPLHLDHIHGDRTRNRPEDVRLLCPNCHSLTSNYQHLNNPKVSPIRVRQSRRYRETWQNSISQEQTRPALVRSRENASLVG